MQKKDAHGSAASKLGECKKKKKKKKNKSFKNSHTYTHAQTETHFVCRRAVLACGRRAGGLELQVVAAAVLWSVLSTSNTVQVQASSHEKHNTRRSPTAHLPALSRSGRYSR